MASFKSRSYGWVQNPSSLFNLHKVICLFNSQSEHYQWMQKEGINLIYFKDRREALKTKLENKDIVFSYLELVGTSRDKKDRKPASRNQAVADSLIQLTILPQKVNTSGKTWTDNWTADGFLRWAVTLGLISVDRVEDTYTITELGKKFSNTPIRNHNQSDLITNEASDILIDAFLRYPPACRILQLLSECKGYVTKFFLGSQLGFIGEKGFSSYPEDLMFDWLLSANKEEASKIRSDIEGTSDKYARGICGWLCKVGLVQQGRVERVSSDRKSGFTGYKITAKGLSAYRRSCGSSKNTKTPRFVMWEFLATATKNRDYVRSRRAFILQYLHLQKNSSITKLSQFMNSQGFYESEKVLLADIEGLQNFGIRINVVDNQEPKKGYLLQLLDDIELEVPEYAGTKEIKDNIYNAERSALIENTNLPLKHLALLDLATQGDSSREFEIATIDLFSDVYRLSAKHLGGSRRPDGVVYSDNCAMIIDTKARSEGYSKNISQQDEMVRYIEDYLQQSDQRNPNKWWEIIPKQILNNKPYFLWVSSGFIGDFSRQLVDTAYVTKTTGGAITAKELLWGAHLVQSGQIKPAEIFNKCNNRVIYFSQVE